MRGSGARGTLGLEEEAPRERSPATPPNDLFTREEPLQGPGHSSNFHGKDPTSEPLKENEAVTLGAGGEMPGTGEAGCG